MEINQLIKDGMKYQEAVEFIEYNTNKPFDLELNKIYNIDAFNLLAELDENSVDLLILDPNYQDWVDFNKRGLMVEAVRVLKKTGNILCFTKQPFDFELRNEVNHIFRREIVWTFTNGGAWVSNRMPLVSHQKIYHCVIDNKKSFFNERTGIDYSESTKSFKRSKKVFEGYEMDGKEFKKNKDGVWLRDHLHFNKPHTGKTPSKPQELYDILIRCYCPENGLVVEPFSGSGNFAKTCIRQNKNYLGSELDKKVFDYSIANVNECGKLF
jgi:DNA modification methylase